MTVFSNPVPGGGGDEVIYTLFIHYVEYRAKNAKPTVGSNYLWGGKQVAKEACRDLIFLFSFPFYLKKCL